MNAITKTNEAMLAALAGATQTIQMENPGGMQYLKLNKVGYWVFGEDLLDIEEDSLWAVNPASFQMGFVAWHKSKKVGEQMASIYGQGVVEANLPAVESSWQRQVSMQLVCVSGDDEGEQVQYTASSVGGSKAFGSLLQAVMKHLQSGKAGDKNVPVLSLSSDSYPHPDYGTVYTPEFTVEKWIANEGFAAPAAEEEEEVEEEVEEAPKKAPPRKRAKRPAKKAVEEEVIEDEEEEEEEPEAPADPPARRRRRARK